jgi:hypothetical protein
MARRRNAIAQIAVSRFSDVFMVISAWAAFVSFALRDGMGREVVASK